MFAIDGSVVFEIRSSERRFEAAVRSQRSVSESSCEATRKAELEIHKTGKKDVLFCLFFPRSGASSSEELMTATRVAVDA